jgi:predicted DNA-binding transcriptional regulator AlpA
MQFILIVKDSENMDTDIRLYKVKQLEQILNISKSTLWQWVKQGKFPTPIKRVGSTFWKSEDVEEWIKNANN